LKNDFVQFKDHVSEDTCAAYLINSVDDENASFETCWKPFGGRFNLVQDILGEHGFPRNSHCRNRFFTAQVDEG
jgi:hypothetical protein